MSEENKIMALVQMLDPARNMDPFLMAGNLVVRSHEIKDWISDHSSRKVPYLPAIRMESCGEHKLSWRVG